MTKEDWAKVQEALSGLYKTVRLNVDGYNVALQLRMATAYKNVIAIYVNDVFKGEWMLNDCEERRCFVQKREKSFYSPKEKERLNKVSKKMLKELKINIEAKFEYYQNHWSSFGALKKHLIANNKEITLVSIGIE